MRDTYRDVLEALLGVVVTDLLHSLLYQSSSTMIYLVSLVVPACSFKFVRCAIAILPGDRFVVEQVRGAASRSSEVDVIGRSLLCCVTLAEMTLERRKETITMQVEYRIYTVE
jgi:hypothetical protein